MGRANRRLVGWGLHDEAISDDTLAVNDGSDSGSDYSQTACRPGSPVRADAIGTLLPHVHHAQVDDLDIIALSAGLPAADTGAGLGYRVDGEADGAYRGWCEPVMVTGYRPVDWTTLETWNQVAAVTCPRSQKVVVAAADVSGNTTASAWVWTPTTRTWSAAFEFDTDGIHDLVALVALRASGRVLAFTGAGAVGFVYVWYSDDDGATWALYAKNAVALNTTVDRISTVEDRNGAILLLAVDEGTNAYWQYASTDAGVSFDLVETVSTTLDFGEVHALANGQILVTYANSTQDAEWRVIDDAFAPISDATLTAIDSTNNVSGMTACVDADGIAYVLLDVSTSDIVKLARSTDNGDTFELFTDHVLRLGMTASGATGHSHTPRAAAPSGGELVALLTSTHTGSPTTDGSLVSLMLGGWSTFEQDGAFVRTSRSGFGDASDADGNGIWLPTEIFASQGWTATGTAETLVSGYHQFSPAAATSFATIAAAGHTAGEMSVLLEARVTVGGAITSNQCSFQHSRRNGALSYVLNLRFATAGFRVRDESGAGSTLADVVVDMATNVVQILIVYESVSIVSVYWRLRGDTKWTLGATTNTLGSDATAATTDQFIVGCRQSTTSTFQVGIVALMADALLTGLTDTTPVNGLQWGKAIPNVPYPVRDQVDADGNMLHLSAEGGVARWQETWELPAEWDHGIREIDPMLSPSPAARWRSTDEAEQIITWDLETDARLGSSWAVFLGLLRVNFRTAVLEYATAAAPTVFVELGTYDGIVAQLVAFDRTGNLLRPGSVGGRGLRYFAAGELKGGHVILDPDGTPVVRRIAWNSGGGWGPTGMQMAIRIEGVDGTEPADGEMHVIAPSGVLVVHRSALTTYRYVRLRIPEQDTAEGYFEIGAAPLGSVFAIGRQFSRGFSTRYIPVVREETDAHGVSYVEPRGGDDDGSVLRECTVSWQDGYDLTKIRIGDPPHLSASEGTPPLVADQDVWFQVAGLVRASKGGAVPSILFFEVPSVTCTITDPSMWSYGRLRGTFQANNVQGQEGQDEVVRCESMTHVELPG